MHDRSIRTPGIPTIEVLKADYQQSMKTAHAALIRRNEVNILATEASSQYDEAARAAKAKRKLLIAAMDAEAGVPTHVVPNLEE